MLRCCDNAMRTNLGRRLKLRCAEVLGMLGAVDPARMPVTMPLPESLCEHRLEGTLTLQVQLVTRHLVRLLETTDNISTLDFATYAIQTLLQTHTAERIAEDSGGGDGGNGRSGTRDDWLTSLSPELQSVLRSSRALAQAGVSMEQLSLLMPGVDADGREGGLFGALRPHVQLVVRPYLTSRFTLEDLVSRAAGEAQGVIFGRGRHSYRRWLELWLKSLSRRVAGPHQRAFSAVTSVLKWDLPLMTFLLPHAVHNIIAYGSASDVAGVRDEVHALLESCREAADGSMPPAPVPEHELYLQTLFTLLDVLGRWVKDMQDTVGTLRALEAGIARQKQMQRNAQIEPAEVPLPAYLTRVADFLDGIPTRSLAQAASRCGAHARALQYFETYVRAENGGAMNPAAHVSVVYKPDQVSFLLEVYGQLEEPDGLSGLVRLRQGGLTRSDQILVAEKAGSWGEALTLYEHQLCTAQAAGEPAAAAAAATSISVNTFAGAGSASGSGRLGGSGPLAVVAGIGGGGGAGGGGLSVLEQGHLRCLLQVGHLQALLQQVDGLLARRAAPLARTQAAALGVAASWRLGSWRVLEEYLGVAEVPSAGGSALGPQDHLDVCVGRLLLGLHAGKFEDVRAGLVAARADIMAILPAISQESYVRAYPSVARLHMLQEVHDALTLMQERQGSGTSAGASGTQQLNQRFRWRERLAATQASLAIQEPLLSLRRQLADLLGLPGEAGLLWLQHSKLCRATGHPEAASTAALHALARDVPGAVLEHAKLLWHTDQQQRAVEELQAALTPLCEAARHPRGDTDRTLHARIALKVATWTAKQGQLGYSELKKLYEDAIRMDDTWEKGYFQYARYLDQLHGDAKLRQTQLKDGGVKSTKATDRLNGRARVALGEERAYYEYLPDILTNYGRAVSDTRRHALHALPRILTLYCDFGMDRVGRRQVLTKERVVTSQVINLMKTLSGSVPTGAWLAVLPQLISRICHPCQDVSDVIQRILVLVTEAYPHQALWSLAAVCKSQVPARRAAASNVIAAAQRKCASEATRRLFDQFAKLAEHLIKLCHWAPPQQRQSVKIISAAQEFGALIKLLPVQVMVPVQDAFVSPMPPVTGATGATAADPGPGLVTLTALEDNVLVMPSLQKPKKITFRGSDGELYPFLAKPKDDLRKDYRLMDFASMLNSLFNKHAASRRRNLRMRTYAVLPLTEDCGILQWVNNLNAFKAACEEVYIAEGLYKRREFTMSTKKLYDSWPEGHSRAQLLDRVLVQLPPRMHRWFLAKFPGPATWLQARLNFTRTNAVWCMVGHMLGLGDRHGENVLIDTASGDTMHVDFGCLFDKGLVLEVPEMVPFRLTQNIVDSFGVSGVEGVFRKCAEITLQVLRQHKDVFMTCAETFLYDPLVDWTKAKPGGLDSAEVENPAAKDALATIQGRLSGTLLGVLSQPSMPLSVQGQAQRLIGEAADKEKLGSMYIWWMPWM
uniref:Serine/threonine-protein kinase ATR n=1 Tax=Chlamydomonas euryale TaxID=1486919 RepID=A0A7R9VTK1_9CHLO